MSRASCPVCFENASPDYIHGSQCAAYTRQRVWNKKIRALLADRTPWDERPVPQASYAWTPDLPPQAPEARAFWRALRALGDWRRDPSLRGHTGGACWQCLAPNRSLAPIPHTCEKAPVHRETVPTRRLHIAKGTQTSESEEQKTLRLGPSRKIIRARKKSATTRIITLECGHHRTVDLSKRHSARCRRCCAAVRSSVKVA